MIVEQRTYTLLVGAAAEYLRLYEAEGLAIQRPILGRMVGYVSTEIGTLHQVAHMWAYRVMNERAERRARMGADEHWKAYIQKVWPLVIKQENQILVPAPFSPWAQDDPALDMAQS